MGEYTIDEVEDTTGCVPLLLFGSVASGEVDLYSPPLLTVAKHFGQFAQGVVAKGGSMQELVTFLGIHDIRTIGCG